MASDSNNDEMEEEEAAMDTIGNYKYIYGDEI